MTASEAKKEEQREAFVTAKEGTARYASQMLAFEVTLQVRDLQEQARRAEGIFTVENPKDAAEYMAWKVDDKINNVYIWASPEGATGGTVNDRVFRDDPSLQEANGKIMYLTFDDGPSQYTERLLDILKENDVKATFFVTAQDPEYLPLLKREAEEGHSIAVHSYLHDYYDIYASTENFWADFEKMQDEIVKYTGYRSELMRFPGGGSNTVSSFTPGIMTTLTAEAEAKGYTYFDWNVSSGDGNAVTDAASVLAGIQSESEYAGDDPCVVLCHDIKEGTVDGIQNVIDWAKSEGYTFLPLSPTSFPAHHGVNN